MWGRARSARERPSSRIVVVVAVTLIALPPAVSAAAGVSVPALAGDDCDALALTPYFDPSIGRIVGRGELDCDEEWDDLFMNTCIFPVAATPPTTSPHPTIQPATMCTNKNVGYQSEANGRHLGNCPISGLYVTYFEGWGIEERPGEKVAQSQFAADESPTVFIECPIDGEEP